MFERIIAGINVLTGIVANAGGRITLPRIAHYCPTWHCNQQCQGCTVWGREKCDELTTKQIERMFSQLPFLDIVKLVGGEPFMRDDLVEIAGTITRQVRPYILQIVTNGSMTDRIIGFVKAAGSPRLHLRVSLSGIGKTHEALSEGSSYEAVHRTIEELSRLRPSLGFGLGINYRVSDETVGDLPKAREIYSRLGVDLVTGVHYSPFLTDIDVENTTFNSEVMDKKRVLSAVVDVPTERANMSWLERVLLGRFSARTAQRELLGDPKKRKFGCRELRNLLYIMPDGDLVICGLRQKTVANLAEDDFREIWRSDNMTKFRQAVDDCPGCPQAAVEIFSRLYLGPFRKRVIDKASRMEK